VANKSKLININQWKRKNHFEFYKNFSDPYFNMCCEIDVSNAITFARTHQYSLFLTLLYLSANACNQITAFKLRLTAQNGVEQFNIAQPAATLLTKDETFTFCNFEYHGDIHTFIKQAKIAREQALQQQSLSKVINMPEHVFYSVIPWLSFTGYKHASNGVGIGHPKIVFGKITNLTPEQSISKSTMPVSVELHHALADGLDVGKYIEHFQNNINHL